MRIFIARIFNRNTTMAPAWMLGWTLIALIFTIAENAFGDEATTHSTRYYVTPEYLVWREYSADDQPILSEFGPRIRGGANFVFTTEEQNARLTAWKIDTSAYLGRVEYSGQDMSQGLAVTTITQYMGVSLDTTYERDLLNTPPLQTGLIVGGKADIWSRDINDGSGATGYTENYQIVTGKLGLHLIPAQNDRLSMDVGLLYPLFTRERVPAYGITLAPTPTTGVFARADLSGLIPFRFSGLSFALTYELMRFEQSPPSGGYMQPKTTISTFGLQFSL